MGQRNSSSWEGREGERKGGGGAATDQQEGRVRHGTLLRIMCVRVCVCVCGMGTATLVLGPGQSYVVDLLLRRIEETFV